MKSQGLPIRQAQGKQGKKCPVCHNCNGYGLVPQPQEPEPKEKKKIAKQIIECFKNGGKLLICGNGGSASMSQHFAAEFTCKFEHDRMPLPAVSLTVDTSALTAISNDYNFNQVFSRQVQALGKPGDILIGLSTSGKSQNVLNALKKAQEMGLTVIDLPRQGSSTAKIQEKQLVLMHDIVRLVEKEFIASS